MLTRQARLKQHLGAAFGNRVRNKNCIKNFDE
jgi:hypothetical protein